MVFFAEVTKTQNLLIIQHFIKFVYQFICLYALSYDGPQLTFAV